MLVVVTAVTTATASFYLTARQYDEKLAHLHTLEQEAGKFKEIADIIDRNFIAEYDADRALDSAISGYITEPEDIRPRPGIKLAA